MPKTPTREGRGPARGFAVDSVQVVVPVFTFMATVAILTLLVGPGKRAGFTGIAAAAGATETLLFFAAAVLASQSAAARRRDGTLWSATAVAAAAMAATQVASLTVILTDGIATAIPRWLGMMYLGTTLAAAVAVALWSQLRERRPVDRLLAWDTALVALLFSAIVLTIVGSAQDRLASDVAAVLAVSMGASLGGTLLGGLALRRSDIRTTGPLPLFILMMAAWSCSQALLLAAVTLRWDLFATMKHATVAAVGLIGWLAAEHVFRRCDHATADWRRPAVERPSGIHRHSFDRDGTRPFIVTLLTCIVLSLASRANSDYVSASVALAALSAVLLIGRQQWVLHVESGRLEDVESQRRDLERIANLDIVTGLPNRNALAQRLREEIERAQRYQQPLSVCFIDLDHFKRINDTLGHLVGDTVLRAVASCLRSTVRSIDFLGRYGGEEFVVIAPGTWTADAVILGERLRAGVEAEPFPIFGTAPISVTISVGIAGFPEHADGLDRLLDLADDALYRSKRDGRNRVTIYRLGSIAENSR